MQEKENAACGLLTKWKFLLQNRFCRLQMIQFESPKVIHPLVSLTFGAHCGLPFSLFAGKEKWCTWLVIEVEIHFEKIGFVDCKWSNFNAPESYPYVSLTFRAHCGLPFSLYAGKRMQLVNKMEKHFAKIGFLGPRVIHPLVSFPFGVNCGVGQFS